LKPVLDLVTISESESDNLHQLENWKNRYRLRSFERKSQILLAQKSLKEEIELLRELLENVQRQSKRKHIPIKNEGEKVYDMYEDELERDHMNEIIAINIENKTIVGYGHTPEEAYLQAKIKEPEKAQFYFRRVGSPYVEIL
jgi:hypothetical protein